MATVALTAENFNQYVEKAGVLVVDWWAPWCGPCRSFAPIYEAASDKHADVTFAKINTEEQPELAGTFQIQAIPTLMVFRDQVLVFARPGMVPAAALDDLVAQVKALDMDDVRKQVAAEEKAEDHAEDQAEEQAEDQAEEQADETAEGPAGAAGQTPPGESSEG